jgi:hypothetical protein
MIHDPSFLLGIPDDTPENTVKTIVEILEEETKNLSVPIKVETQKKGMSVDYTIDINPENYNKSFRMIIGYVDSLDLKHVAGTIGNGFISANKNWKLELISQNQLGAHDRPSFSWGLWAEDKHGNFPKVHSTKPNHILDGLLLRNLLRERLGLPLLG